MNTSSSFRLQNSRNDKYASLSASQLDTNSYSYRNSLSNVSNKDKNNRAISQKLLYDVSVVRQRNKNRKRIETLFCISTLCCAVLFIARFRHDQWIKTFPNIAVFPAFISSLLLSIIWLIQLIQIYNQPDLKISAREQRIASIADDEEGFQIVDDTRVEDLSSKHDFQPIDFSRTTSNLLDSHSKDFSQTSYSNSYNSILLIKDSDKSNIDANQLFSSGHDGHRKNIFSTSDNSSNLTRSKNESSIMSYLPGSPSPTVSLTKRRSIQLDFCNRFKLVRELTITWRENLRKWLTQDLLLPISQEIDLLNNKLASSHLQIGVDSIEHLKSSNILISVDLARLKKLLPFLEVCSNQGYVIHRIKELSKLCMSCYKWNSGGNFESKPWNELLPTDCDVVFHLFVTYMDSIFPTNALHINGRYFVNTFTKGHVYSQPNSDKSATPIIIHKYRSSPCMLKIIYDQENISIDEGPYNLFDAITAFLYIVKYKLDGRLSSVNLQYVCPNVMNIVAKK
ncbi:hypothetical protein GJ496_005163 [Pomphorhynchus laevis]|nr:hypothetical protein GJ496_005163 [Pomphorhynchus laevis]